MSNIMKDLSDGSISFKNLESVFANYSYLLNGKDGMSVSNISKNIADIFGGAIGGTDNKMFQTALNKVFTD